MPSKLPRIIYSSPHVPAEWIAAHGCLPCRITPGTGAGNTWSGMGVCPYAAALMRTAEGEKDAAGIVLTTACDQMRRLSEPLAATAKPPIFLMNVPTAVNAPTAMTLYHEETVRLGRFLESLGGERPSDAHLTETMIHYDTARRRLREKRKKMKGRSFSAMLMRFQRGDWSVLDEPHTDALDSGTALALVGGPLRMSDLCLFDEIDVAGGRVVLDATTTGERTLPPPFDFRMLRDRPLDILLETYLRLIPDAFQRPNTALHAYIRSVCEERNIRGLIVRHYIWCDTWQVEAARLGDATGLPVLHLDIGEEDDSMRQAGRILAFLEMLS